MGTPGRCRPGPDAAEAEGVHVEGAAAGHVQRPRRQGAGEQQAVGRRCGHRGPPAPLARLCPPHHTTPQMGVCFWWRLCFDFGLPAVINACSGGISDQLGHACAWELCGVCCIRARACDMSLMVLQTLFSKSSEPKQLLEPKWDQLPQLNLGRPGSMS